MATRIQIRRGTAAEWSSANPVLASGEFGYETDTGVLKIGDGSTAYNSLDPFASGTTGGGGYTFVQIESIDGPPTSPSVGDTWFDPENANTYLRYNDGVTTQWIQSGTTIGAGSTVIDADDVDDSTSVNKFTDALEKAAIAAAAPQIDSRVECIWTGSAWTTNAGETVPTDPTLLRAYASLDDPAATPPTIYNANDIWYKVLV